MGSKNSAPAPDPRLIEAQIRSMGIQDDVIRRIVDNTERFQPLQEEQMRFGLDAARRAQTESAADREWMLGRRAQLSGLQDRLVDDANSFNTEERADQLAGQAMGDVQQAFGLQRQTMNREMERMGVNPNDGRFAAMNNSNAIAAAAAQSSAASKVREAARQEGYALTDRATNALAGYPAMGMNATAAGANFGAAGMNMANQGLAGMNSGYGMAGQMAGQMGQNATNMYGIQSRDYYQQGESFGSILGGIGGLATGAARLGLFSDRRMKTDVVLVGSDEGTGLNLYEFTYKDLPGHRFRGVMADEVRKVMPKAVQRDESGYDRVDYTLLGIEMVEV